MVACFARRAWFGLVLAVATVGQLHAAPVSMTGDTIKSTISGRTLNLDTPMGAALPITFREDGTMTGRAGKLAFYLGSSKDTGRWWVRGSKLCQKWSRWLDREETCIRVMTAGDKISWRRDDGLTGTASLVPLPPTTTGTPVLSALGGPKSEPIITASLATESELASTAATMEPVAPSRRLEPEEPAAPLRPASQIAAVLRSDNGRDTQGFSNLATDVATQRDLVRALVTGSWNSETGNQWCRLSLDQPRTQIVGHADSAEEPALLSPEQNVPVLLLQSQSDGARLSDRARSSACLALRPTIFSFADQVDNRR